MVQVLRTRTLGFQRFLQKHPSGSFRQHGWDICYSMPSAKSDNLSTPAVAALYHARTEILYWQSYFMQNAPGTSITNYVRLRSRCVTATLQTQLNVVGAAFRSEKECSRWMAVTLRRISLQDSCKTAISRQCPRSRASSSYHHECLLAFPRNLQIRSVVVEHPSLA